MSYLENKREREGIQNGILEHAVNVNYNGLFGVCEAFTHRTEKYAKINHLDRFGLRAVGGMFASKR